MSKPVRKSPRSHLRLVPPPRDDQAPPTRVEHSTVAALVIEAAAALQSVASMGLEESLLWQALTTRLAVALGRTPVSNALHASGPGT